MNKREIQINSPEDKKVDVDGEVFTSQMIRVKEKVGRGLASIRLSLDASIIGLDDCIKKNNCRLIPEDSKSSETKNEQQQQNIGNKDGKKLSGYLSDKLGKFHTKNLKRETELQHKNIAIKSNYIKAKINNA